VHSYGIGPLASEVKPQVQAEPSDIFHMMRRFTLALAVVALSLLAASCGGEVLTLEVGTCFDDPESFEEVSDVPRVDCPEPHDNEVIALRQLEGSSFPGDDVVAGLADELCIVAFDGYIGVPYEDSLYEFGWLVPTSASWDAGDREVICFIYDPTFAKITGSVLGVAA